MTTGIDIIDLLGTERRYNLHSHTQFCDGRATMEEFAAEAVAKGFRHYGFSPHSPVPIESPCNMDTSDVPLYLAEVSRIRNEYSESDTRFYASMEIDFLGEQWGAHLDYFKTLPLDYRISSIHFIPAQDGRLVDIDGHFDAFRIKMHQHFHDDIRYVVDTFFERSMMMLQLGGFDIIGHFDKISHNGSMYHSGLEDETWYKAHIDNLIDAIRQSGVIVELNTKAPGRLFPSHRWLKRVVEAGIPIIVNSDAHVPALINAGRDEAFALLDSLSK